MINFFKARTAIPGKNLVNSFLNETEKIKRNYRVSILNGKIKILSVFDRFWGKNNPFYLIP